MTKLDYLMDRCTALKPANDAVFWVDVGPLVAFDEDQTRRVTRNTTRARKAENWGGVFILSCIGIMTGCVVGAVL
tara:strand:+ start:1645 stop:1869 length:225 start_codon:yes stop_codon:yes gene_type:complete